MPAFVEMFIDHDVLQEIWTTGLMFMVAGNLPWDELSEKNKEIIDQVWERTGPMYLQMGHPTWAEGLGAYRAEKGK